MNPKFLLALTLLCLATAAAENSPIDIDGAWARPTPPGAVNGAAYFLIVNPGPEPNRLLGAFSEVAERVELHTHSMDEGVMRMRQVENVDLPVGRTVSFAPGQLHAMLLGLTGALIEGETFPLTLQLERGGDVTVNVLVKHPQ